MQRFDTARRSSVSIDCHGAPQQFQGPKANASQSNMSPPATSHLKDLEPGQLLKDLEQRQDEVLEQLDRLDSQLEEVLRGLGVTSEDEMDEELV